MSTWKEVRTKAEPFSVAGRVCAWEQHIQKQLLFKLTLTKKWSSFLLKYLLVFAATMGGTSHIKICFIKCEQSWLPSNRPQSLGLLLAESSAPNVREQIPEPPSPLLPALVPRAAGMPQLGSAHLGLTSSGVEDAKSHCGRVSQKTCGKCCAWLVQSWFLFALNTPKRTGREAEGNYRHSCSRSMLELHVKIQDPRGTPALMNPIAALFTGVTYGSTELWYSGT